MRTIAKQVKKYGEVKNLALHQQMKTPTYFVKYEKEENEVQALMELTKEEGVAEVIAVDHCFRKDQKKKHQDGYSAHLKKERQTI